MFSDDSAADDLWNHCGKRRNCSWWAISPSAIRFQLYKIIMIIIYWVYLNFKVVCCRFIVYGKVIFIILFHIQHIFSRRLWEYLCKNMENLYKWTLSLLNRVLKHCGIRRRCSLKVLSSFTKVLSKVVLCCRRVQIWERVRDKVLRIS